MGGGSPAGQNPWGWILSLLRGELSPLGYSLGEEEAVVGNLPAYQSAGNCSLRAVHALAVDAKSSGEPDLALTGAADWHWVRGYRGYREACLTD
jgi:hypothetical protein